MTMDQDKPKHNIISHLTLTNLLAVLVSSCSKTRWANKTQMPYAFAISRAVAPADEPILALVRFIPFGTGKVHSVNARVRFILTLQPIPWLGVTLQTHHGLDIHTFSHRPPPLICNIPAFNHKAFVICNPKIAHMHASPTMTTNPDLTQQTPFWKF